MEFAIQGFDDDEVIFPARPEDDAFGVFFQTVGKRLIELLIHVVNVPRLTSFKEMEDLGDKMPIKWLFTYGNPHLFLTVRVNRQLSRVNSMLNAAKNVHNHFNAKA